VVGCLYGLGAKVAQNGLQAGFEPMGCFWLMSEQIWRVGHSCRSIMLD